MATAQRLARHSDPRLTANVYTHIDEATKAEAIASLDGIRATNQTGQTDEPESVVAPFVALTDAKEGQAEAMGDNGSEMGRQECSCPNSLSEETLAAFLRLLTELEKVHPRGFEPLTFGSVDRDLEIAIPIAPNDLRQPEKLGYSHGYRSGCPPLSEHDADCLQLANWFAEVWPHLPAELREQIIALIESALPHQTKHDC